MEDKAKNHAEKALKVATEFEKETGRRHPSTILIKEVLDKKE